MVICSWGKAQSWQTLEGDTEQASGEIARVWGGCMQVLCCAVEMSDNSFQSAFLQAPHVIHMRAGVKMGAASLQDTILLDGLTDAFYQYHMGITGKW